MSFTFTGTSVQWITSLANNHGYANIYLDGTLVQSNVDTYAASSVNQYAAYTASGLSYGSHTLEIYVDGTKDANSAGTYVTTDAMIVGTGTTTGTGTSTTAGTTSGSSRPHNVFTFPLEASYQIDLWGSIRNTVAVAAIDAIVNPGDSEASE